LEGNNAVLRIGLGRSMLAGANDSISSSAGDCNQTTCVEGYYTGPGNGAAVAFRRRYLAVTYLQGSNIPAKRMAVAHLTCVRGCKCKPIQLTFRNEASTSIAATEVSRNINCMTVCSLQPWQGDFRLGSLGPVRSAAMHVTE
jgi:hypothetical protein